MGMRQRGTARRIVLGLELASVLIAGALTLPSPAAALPGFPPTASIVASPNPTLRNQTVTFDGTGSTRDIGGAAITKYEWDLDGTGGFEVNTGASPTASRSYSSLGPVTVRLRVTDADNDVSSPDSDTLQVVNADPTAGFIFEPSTPATNEQITFSSTSSDPDGTIPSANHHWDFDEDGQFDDATGETVTTSFATADTYTVGLQITDSDGASDTATRDVLVQANPPNATFTFSPPTPSSGDTISLDASGSTAPSGETITAINWDLDNDTEFDDASGPTTTTSYPTPGNRTIGVRVDSSGGGFDIVTHVVPIANRGPSASFVFVPQSPRTDDVVQFTSTATDPDDPIVEWSWDLDGDSEFDDASGVTAQRAFATVGTHTVGLRVRDASGATNATTVSVAVVEKPLQLMSPFPVVRLSGELKPNGNTEVNRLSVRAESGTDVIVTCRHKDCPFDEKVRAVKVVRVGFPAIEESLKPGVVIEVFVTDPTVIGKYTRFKIRKDRAPRRRDKCLEGESREPTKCPS